MKTKPHQQKKNKKGGGHKKGGGKHGGGHHKKGGGSHQGMGGQGVKPDKTKKDDFSISDYLKQPGPFVKPLSRKEYGKEESAARHAQFAPETRQLEAEKRASAGRVKEVGDWFNEYDKKLKQLQVESAIAYKDPSKDIGKASVESAEYANKLRKQLNQQESTSAQQRGAHVDTAQSAAEIAGQGIRQNTAATFRGVLNAQQKSEVGNLRQKKAIGARSKIDQQQREEARGRSLDADLRDLAVRKGDFSSQFRSQNRQSERDFYLGLLQAQLGKQQDKRSAEVAKAGQRQDTKQSKISAKTSKANSRRSLKAQLASIKAQKKQDMKTLKAQLAANQIDYKQFKIEQANLNKRARLSAQTSRQNSKRTAQTSRQNSRRTAETSRQNSRRSNRPDRGGGGAGGGSPRIKNDPVHVQQMRNWLDTHLTSKGAKPQNKSAVIQKLLGQSSTYSRGEANAAYQRWLKANKGGGGKKKKHKHGGGAFNLGHGGGVSGHAGVS